MSVSANNPPPAAARPPAVLTDFDDTAAVQNVAELLLERFGRPDWTAVRQRFRDGALSLKEYQEITFLDIRADKIAMQEYVRSRACFRPGFAALWQYCQANGLPMCVVSQGLDFYVQALLDGIGLPGVPVYAVDTTFDDNGRIAGYAYAFTNPDAPELGNSKAVLVQRFQQQGHHVFFMGDGRSDFEAGTVADTVFAHRQMAAMCDDAGVAYIPFTDFAPVLDAVKRHMAGVLA